MPDKVLKILRGLLVFFAFIVLLELGFYFYPRFFKSTSVVSNIQGYSIQVNDTETFDKLLTDAGFGVTSNKSFYNYEEAKWQKYSSIVVNFTNTPQSYGKVVGGKDMELVSSFGQSLDNGSLNINVYVNQAYFSDENTFREISSDALIRSLFLTKHPDYYENKEVEAKMDELVLQYLSSPATLLKISGSQSNIYKSTLTFLKRNNPFKVQSVSAQSCFGNYECGTVGTSRICSNSGAACSSTYCGRYVNSSCGTCVCTNNVCLSGSGGPQNCGGTSYAACMTSRCSTSGSCLYSGACSWDGGTSTPSPTTPPGPGTIDCGTQTCNASTEVCCVTGCKPIAEGCSPPATTPPTATPVPVYNPIGYHDSSACDFSYGWACDADNYAQSLDIHFYLDGPFGTGTYMGFTNANVAAEPGVAAACGGYANHRFNFVTPESLKDGNPHTIYAYAINIGTGTNILLNQTPKSVTCSVPVANCKNITGTTSLYVGDTATFTATYENGTGPVTTEGMAIYSEGQCEPNTPAYWSQIFAAPGTYSFNWVPSAVGTYDVDCRAWNDGISECRGRCFFGTPPIYQCAGPTATMKVTVLAPTLAWWQVKDADVLANGDVRSSVPTSLYFNLVGSGGFPGVVAYSASTNLTSTNVSTTKWLAKTAYSSNKVYGSGYFVNSIPSGATINNVTATSVPGSFFESGGTAYNGYYWYVYDGAAYGGINLTISSPASLGARKVILIVKNASLNISGNIGLTKGSGFFLGVTSGNINVSSGVGGGASANLQGIYIADGTFNTGTGGTKTDSQLWVRGTVAGYGGINLQRDLGNVNNSTKPGEFFEYAPDLELLFPIELATQITNWREIAP